MNCYRLLQKEFVLRGVEARINVQNVPRVPEQYKNFKRLAQFCSPPVARLATLYSLQPTIRNIRSVSVLHQLTAETGRTELLCKTGLYWKTPLQGLSKVLKSIQPQHFFATVKVSFKIKVQLR